MPDAILNLPNLGYGTLTRAIPLVPSLNLTTSRHISLALTSHWEMNSAGSANNKVLYGTVHSEPVAVKLYGGAVTTDGQSIDEMMASLLAGSHDNIIGAKGWLTDAPNQQMGLIMPVIPPEFKQLAKPPNLTSLTRDTYSTEQTYSAPFTMQVLRDVSKRARTSTQSGHYAW